MGAKGTKNMTEQNFKMIKSLTDMNLKNSQIGQITGRSYNTIAFVKSSKDFDEYRTRREQYYNKHRTAQPQVSPEVQELSDAAERVSKADNSVELIRALNDLTAAMNALALSWDHLSDKMDEVLETKRPWMFGQRKG